MDKLLKSAIAALLAASFTMHSFGDDEEQQSERSCFLAGEAYSSFDSQLRQNHNSWNLGRFKSLNTSGSWSLDQGIHNIDINRTADKMKITLMFSAALNETEEKSILEAEGYYVSTAHLADGMPTYNTSLPARITATKELTIENQDINHESVLNGEAVFCDSNNFKAVFNDKALFSTDGDNREYRRDGGIVLKGSPSDEPESIATEMNLEIMENNGTQSADEPEDHITTQLSNDVNPLKHPVGIHLEIEDPYKFYRHTTPTDNQLPSGTEWALSTIDSGLNKAYEMGSAAYNTACNTAYSIDTMFVPHHINGTTCDIDDEQRRVSSIIGSTMNDIMEVATNSASYVAETATNTPSYVAEKVTNTPTYVAEKATSTSNYITETTAYIETKNALSKIANKAIEDGKKALNAASYVAKTTSSVINYEKEVAEKQVELDQKTAYNTANNIVEYMGFITRKTGEKLMSIARKADEGLMSIARKADEGLTDISYDAHKITDPITNFLSDSSYAFAEEAPKIANKIHKSAQKNGLYDAVATVHEKASATTNAMYEAASDMYEVAQPITNAMYEVAQPITNDMYETASGMFERANDIYEVAQSIVDQPTASGIYVAPPVSNDIYKVAQPTASYKVDQPIVSGIFVLEKAEPVMPPLVPVEPVEPVISESLNSHFGTTSFDPEIHKYSEARKQIQREYSVPLASDPIHR